MKKSNYSSYLVTIYLILVVWILLFKMSSFNEIQNLDIHRTINLIPFYIHPESGINRADIIRNFLVFIPLGIYFMMMNYNFFKAVLYGAAISIGIEILQFLFGIGVTDINDMMTNTAGAFVGIIFYSLISIFFKRKETLNHVLQIIATFCTLILLVLIFILIFSN